MPDKEQAYYRMRARQEREHAATCEDNTVALIHLELADQYLRRAGEPDQVVVHASQNHPSDRTASVLPFPILRN